MLILVYPYIAHKGIVNYILMNTLGSNGNDKCGQTPRIYVLFLTNK